jgi:hypothetical protein
MQHTHFRTETKTVFASFHSLQIKKRSFHSAFVLLVTKIHEALGSSRHLFTYVYISKTRLSFSFQNVDPS